MIRTDLKHSFPGIKFSVRSSSYSGGGSIDVRWTDGPTRDRVRGIIGRYQDRGFDGSIDLEYHIEHFLLPDGTIMQGRSQGTQGSMGYVPSFDEPLPEGAELVRLNTGYLDFDREYSDAFRARCLPKVPTNVYDHERDQWLWRIMSETEG
jgi:hypothetical protein